MHQTAGDLPLDECSPPEICRRKCFKESVHCLMQAPYRHLSSPGNEKAEEQIKQKKTDVMDRPQRSRRKRNIPSSISVRQQAGPPPPTKDCLAVVSFPVAKDGDDWRADL
ncbi:hypothetical protein CDAR_313411 [Caerostris darwini]|uniref:Uncharacterized protein n=1 Tax=Caerostris darwini TaxID=1538125 RepID=A0AAV4PFV1_9ARAC|nr:hypothetical protein CDAR_313411 [Caerostris darwini]